MEERRVMRVKNVARKNVECDVMANEGFLDWGAILVAMAKRDRREGKKVGGKGALFAAEKKDEEEEK
jgi:hypothetical protein